jgi:hypothetical protein
MAKKQTRRSISVSRTTYERLKAFCESNNISMSQFVETRVGDFLGQDGTTTVEADLTRPAAPRPAMPAAIPASIPPKAALPPKTETSAPRPGPAAAQQVPMTSAAARYAVEPPPPVIKPKQEQPAPKPAEKRPDQIFTF